MAETQKLGGWFNGAISDVEVRAMIKESAGEAVAELLPVVGAAIVAARSSLAQKVLETVRGEQLQEHLDNEGDMGYRNAINDVYVSLRELFRVEGVEPE